LLILDNCDNSKVDYSRYIPSGPHVDVIMTTRVTTSQYSYASQRPSTEPPDYLHLAGLDRESAVALLLNKSNKSREDKHALEAYRLAALLEYHPLALTVAGSLIRSGIYSIPGFAEEFEVQTTQEDLLRTESVRSPYLRIDSTFEISAQSLQHIAATDSTAAHALAVLEVFAFFDRSNITEDIFTRSWAFEEQVLSKPDDNNISKLSSWHVARSRAMLYSANTSGRLRAFRKACALLDELSLIQRSADNCISLHPLLHTWARQRVGHKDTAWSRSASILALSTENSEEWQPFTFQLQRHMEASFVYSPKHKGVIEADLIFHCKILYLYGCQLYRAHNVHTTKVCEDLVARTETIFPRLIDLDQVLEARFLLAIGYQRNPHQVTEAVEMFEHILRMQTDSDKDNPTRLNFEHGLALAYLKSKQFEQALRLAKHVVQVRRRTLPEHNASRCSTEHILARAHLGLGQIDQAIEILGHIVRVEDKLPENDHRRLASQYELANAYLDDGQVERAARLLDRIVSVWRESVEESHSDRLKAEHNLARAHYENGALEQAIELQQHVVGVRCAILPVQDEQRNMSEASLEQYLKAKQNEGRQWRYLRIPRLLVIHVAMAAVAIILYIWKD
jgi:tetratricopeptide (TPR) repeat protein